jgi:chaperonin GroES
MSNDNKRDLLEDILKYDGNLLDILEDDEISRIGSTAVANYEADCNDPKRANKKAKWEAGQKMVQMTMEEKNTPYPNSSNVKYPMLMTAAVQFNSRAYPGIIQGNSVVKPKLVGSENPEIQKKADRVAEYINWQLFNEIEEWEEDTDKMLLQLPLYGCMFRKIWYDQDEQRLRSALYTPEQLVVPANTESLATTPRISEPFTLRPNEIVEKVISGEYLEMDNYADIDAEEEEEFLCQYTLIDLDGDGYKEPYKAIIHIDSGKVLRLEPNFLIDEVYEKDGKIQKIDRMEYFVKYTFIPSTDDCFYDIGFFDILYPINEVVNTTLNQLLDAGKLQNSSTGFVSSKLKLRKKGGIGVKIGQYVEIPDTGEDIRRSIMPMQFGGPSTVLFQLLGYIVDAGREVASLKDVLEGESAASASPTTTIALIEQGLKVFSAIYTRVHRATKKELAMIRKWNYLTRSPLYGIVLNDDQGLSYEDFREDDLDFIPVSDPAIVTDMQKMAKTQFKMQFLNDPTFDQVKLKRDIWESTGMGDFDDLYSGQSPEAQQIQELQKQVQQLTQQLDSSKFERKLKTKADRRADVELVAKVKAMKAGGIRDIAEAEAKEMGANVNQYKTVLETLNERPQEGDGGRAGGMGNGPGNAGDGRGIPRVGPGPRIG